MNSEIKIGLVSLGCPKNEADAEVMLHRISEAGYTIENDSSKCNLIIINTCGFLGVAKQEAIDTIFDIAKLKEDGDLKKIIVSGCFSGRYSDTLFDEMPEIDAILGVSQYPFIVDYIKRCLGDERFVCAEIDETLSGAMGRILMTPPHRAYLKIAEGCSNCCTYCAIPSIRGKLRSRPIDDIITEAKELITQGVKEITLVAQDTTRYGIDINESFTNLLDIIAQLDKDVWIRVLYMYPEMITDSIIKIFKKHDNICKYMDIPLQHVSDKILKTMNRHTTHSDIIKMYNNIRKQLPDVSLRTTYITGFPGETQADYDMLVDFIHSYPFDNVGVFSYSREEGTPAYDMTNQIPTKTSDERRDLLLQYQSEISLKLMERRVGNTYKVLIEDLQDTQYFGRSEHFTAEIDGEIQIESTNELNIGEYYRVKITSASMYDLQGKIGENNDNSQ